MDATVIQSVRTEEEELLRKLAAVQALLVAYGERPFEAVGQAPTRAPVAEVTLAKRARSDVTARDETLPLRDKKSIETFTPYGREAIATAMRVLIGQSGPMKTRELVRLMTDGGFKIRGDNAINALGALLGRSENIVSHGKTGWTLADPELAGLIVDMYAHVENEPLSVPAGGSDAAGEGASPPDPALIRSHWGSDS